MNKYSLFGSFLCRYLVQAPVAIIVFLFLPFQSAFATDVADFALGDHSICIVDTEGNLSCTTNDASFYLPPDTTTKYKAVSSGANFSCAITEAGAITCWGLANFGALDSPVSNANFVAISSSEGHSCALDSNGQVSCWGLNSNGQTNVPADNSDFVAIHTGTSGSCGIKSTGALVCWSNTSPYTGFDGRDGIMNMRLEQNSSETSCLVDEAGSSSCFTIYVPTAPLNDGPYTKVTSNRTMLCGLKTDGDMDCNLRGTSQAQTVANQTLLGYIESLPPMVDFDTRADSTSRMSFCGVDIDRQLHCFGDTLPADRLPGEQVVLPIPTDLDIGVYGANSAELFWSFDFTTITGAPGQFRIYRNGEMVRQSFANASYFDSDFEVGVPYVYEVSYIAPDGVEGPRSEPFSVNGEFATPDADADINPANPNATLSGISVSRYGEGSLEIFWDRPSSNIRQYDVYRNGVLAASVPGPSYFDNQINTFNAYQYTISAVTNSGDIEAIGFAQVESFSGLQCF